ncbi:uncharacterized protein EI90DRAFT_3041104 [Cantharellus anzutake]|uniref:uncharacterized protein n=1 Tax=Cantharellus anzutake TaxID=1750568 RepID=UPI0019051D6E|nr:uncharacterized protein EI90DRAFT_3041104 [Cantharellus anzutake]KAF8337936.1 hypothetical protein EI90DRAFT_3041104 [Cantharellus anzutake]
MRALKQPADENPDNEHSQHFDYDVAKFMLQLTSILYERENDSIRKAVHVLANTRPLSYAPIIGGAAQNIVSNSFQERLIPGDLVRSRFGAEKADEVRKMLDSRGDMLIKDWCMRFGIEFEVVSELNDTASTFAGLFWDPRSNWIMVACKGATPAEFGEWLSTFDPVLVESGDHSTGFKFHKGSRERVFPSEPCDLGHITPYDSISLGVKTLAKHLRRTNGLPQGAKINVWFTGHSFGCATASLVYSKFLTSPEDMGKNAELRDVYLFGAPAISDTKYVQVFNQKMLEDPKCQRAMWRITSNGDAVAVCFPKARDWPLHFSYSNVAFVHLGTEVKLRDYPLKCVIVENRTVCVSSHFTTEQIAAQRSDRYTQQGEERRELVGMLLQRIPIFGRLFAPCAMYYWDQLNRVSLGQCEQIVG